MSDRAAARALLTPEAVRERCRELYEIGLGGDLPHFHVELSRLDDAVERVAAEIARNYPDGAVPLHSRWRHFELDECERWAAWLAAAPPMDAKLRARCRFDLAIVSVLLDAGAGPDWRYREPGSARTYARSEGLALAGFHWLAEGGLSAGGDVPMRVDAAALAALGPEHLAAAFQVTADNPLTGLAARADLLNRLGRCLLDNREVFARDGACRPGFLFDFMQERAGDSALPAREILVAVLALLGGIWPHGPRLGDVALGDVGCHPALRRDDASDRLVPFHKLSQWLSYSLIEPLEEAGVAVCDLDGLTGLAEYRNGGLFLDAGVLVAKDPDRVLRPQAVDGELVVEWRALTVALLDELASRLRLRLGSDRDSLPLGAVLQGGSWSAGRRIAAEKRSDGSPPLSILSDGTVF